MAGRPRTIRLSEVVGSKIVTPDGRKVGRVADLRVTPGPTYRVTALEIGTPGWLDRLGIAQVFKMGKKFKQKPHLVPWDAVAELDDGRLILKPGRAGDVRPDEP